MPEPDKTPTPSEPVLTPGRLLATARRWAIRWGAIGFLIGGVGMFWIVLPYDDFLAQLLLIKGPLGAAVGALVGAVGGVVYSFARHKPPPRTRAVGGLLIVACSGGVVFLFWVWLHVLNG